MNLYVLWLYFSDDASLIGIRRQRADLHILSLSTGDPHPEAKFPRIRLPAHGGLGHEIQIVGDVALVLCSESDGRNERQIIIYLVNWKLGLLTHVSEILVSIWVPITLILKCYRN